MKAALLTKQTNETTQKQLQQQQKEKRSMVLFTSGDWQQTIKMLSQNLTNNCSRDQYAVENWILFIAAGWTLNTNRPAYPKYFCQCQYSKQPVSIFSYFWPDFLCFAFDDAPPVNQNKTEVSKDNFSIIHLVRTVYKLTFSIIQMPLFCLHLLNTFWIKDRRTLSPKAMNGCSLVRACFLAFFLLFVSFMWPFVTDTFQFKPAVSEDG